MAKTWSVMYGLIWATFFQIFLIVFLLSVAVSGFWYDATIGFHVLLGILVIALGNFSFRLVRRTTCPERIRRIAKTTAILSIVQGILGLVLYALITYNASSALLDFVLLLHIVTALAIIAQASSSATAFDMWEEKEFLAPNTAPLA